MDAACMPDTGIVLRPISPLDAAALVRFHHRLSPETTYLRFFTFHPELSEEEVAWFTNVDHVHREAFVATVDDEIIGVARFDRVPGTARAEVAIVVEDAWHSHGVGTTLLGCLGAAARLVGITEFSAQALASNCRVLALFRRAGGRWAFDDGFADISVPLEEESCASIPQARQTS